MKFSERHLINDSQCNGLDMGYETVTHRHRGQRWKYQYPRHIRPHASTLSKLEITNHYTLDSREIVTQGLDGHICPISRQNSTNVNVNDVSKVPLVNICLNLERRLKTAQLKGDEWLISLLEKEFQDLGQMCVDYL